MKKLLCIMLVLAFSFSPLLAQENTAAIEEDDLVKINFELKSMAKGIGIGLAVSGAAAGIGAMVAAATEGIARQPEASDTITDAMNTGVYACAGLAIGAIVATFFF